jgi:hypothetical protein
LIKFLKKSNENNVFVFTDTVKTKSISNFYKNATCFITRRINNKNLNKYYYENIKKHEKLIFKYTNQIILITIAFPRKGSKANTLSIIDKKDIL